MLDGPIAQLGERLICIQEVIGSIPFGSTRKKKREYIDIVKCYTERRRRARRGVLGIR